MTETFVEEIKDQVLEEEVQKTEDLLEMYYTLSAEEESKKALYETELAELVPPEIKQSVEKFTAEHREFLSAITERKESLRAQIEKRVLAAGETAKSDHVSAIWIKGREGGWDSGKLKGFAMAHPEIMAAKKPDGAPTVSFRFAK
jgi:hypothetical protein